VRTEFTTALIDRTEKDLVTWLFDDPFIMIGALRYVIDAAVGFHTKGWTFETWLHLDRKELGLNPDRKPGDIDILLVPVLGADRFAERAIAIEVKKAVISRSKRGKSPNSFGLEQCMGLLRDGFPIVSALHLMFVENSEREKMYWVPLHETGVHKIGESTQIGHVIHDPASLDVRARNVGRLEKMFGDDEISYNLLAYTVDKTGLLVESKSESSGRTAKVNSNRKASIVAKLKKLAISPDLRIVFHYSGFEVRWRDHFLEPSPRDQKEEAVNR
jgi:hypothetical protein